MYFSISYSQENKYGSQSRMDSYWMPNENQYTELFQGWTNSLSSGKWTHPNF